MAVLYTGIAERVRRTARCILDDEHAAEDTVQDTFLAVIQRLPELRDNVAFETWVLRIARNLAIDARRRRLRCRPSAALHREGGIPEHAIVHRRGSREAAPLAVVVVRVALEELSSPIRETLELYYGAGYSCRAIARRQGISLANVKSRLCRGRRALREAFHATCR